jgi:hypothetical protein
VRDGDDARHVAQRVIASLPPTDEITR